MYIRVDHAELKIEIQAEQVQQVFGASTSAKCDNTNIAFGSRQAPMHLTTIHDFCL
jgi:hypothetical protein